MAILRTGGFFFYLDSGIVTPPPERSQMTFLSLLTDDLARIFLMVVFSILLPGFVSPTCSRCDKGSLLCSHLFSLFQA